MIRSPRNSKSRCGYSLLEMVVSLSVSSLLVTGMTSSMYLAMKSNDVGIGPFRPINNASDAVLNLDRELTYATTIFTSVNSAKAIEFQLPDQTGDGAAETVRYQWSGTAGDPLQRIFNNGTPEVILSGVQLFRLDPQVQDLTSPGPVVQSDSQQWISQTSSFFSDTGSIYKNQGIGTDFLPELPTGVTSWSIDSVQLKCARHGTTDGVIRARITIADEYRQPGQVVDEVLVNESSLSSSLSWTTISFSNAGSLTPGQRVCVVFLGKSGSSEVMDVQVLKLSLFSADTWLLTSSNGSNWSQDQINDLAIKIFGKYRTQNSIETSYCQSVGVQLQPTSSATSTVQSRIRTYNQPKVTGP
jgi:hypothetical protein